MNHSNHSNRMIQEEVKGDVSDTTTNYYLPTPKKYKMKYCNDFYSSTRYSMNSSEQLVTVQLCFSPLSLVMSGSEGGLLTTYIQY